MQVDQAVADNDLCHDPANADVLMLTAGRLLKLSPCLVAVTAAPSTRPESPGMIAHTAQGLRFSVISDVVQQGLGDWRRGAQAD